MELLPGPFSVLSLEIIESIFNKCSLPTLLGLSRVSRQFQSLISERIENGFHPLSKSDFKALKKKITLLDLNKIDLTLLNQKNQTLFQLVLLVHLSATPYLWISEIEKYRVQKQLVEFEAYLEAKKRFEDNLAVFTLEHPNLEGKLAVAHQKFKAHLKAKTFAWLTAMKIQAHVDGFDGITNFNETTLVDAGTIFFRGLKCLKMEESAERGLKMIHISALLNFPPAMTKLAAMYLKGDRVSLNIEKAVAYYQQAIEYGDVVAQLNYGYLLIFGSSIDKDESKGFNLAKKAAERGFPEAQYMLGFCYWYGIFVKKNPALALQYYRQAAKKNDLFATAELGILYSSELSPFYNPQKGFKWSLKAAKKGFEPLQVYLGYCYVAGKGVKENLDKAFYWTKKGAESGNDMALNNLACLYELGLGTHINVGEALRLYQKSAELGNKLAQKNLGNLVARLTLENE